MAIKNLSDSDIAQATNLPLMTIRRIVSGETTDPRIATLKLITDFLDVSIDAIISNKMSYFSLKNYKLPFFVPILDWELVSSIEKLSELELNKWEFWQPIAIDNNFTLSRFTFALESRVSMQPRYPAGTLLIIDPEVKPTDGDIVLFRSKNTNELFMKEVMIDSPSWQLIPLIPNSSATTFNKKEFEIIGTVILTMLYTKK